MQTPNNKKATDLVSVIIPSYNHERYIEETIRSFIAQTHDNIELLIIDDGSKDETWEKIQQLLPEMRHRFSRVYVERQKNHGCSYTMEKLQGMCQGEYFFPIASDDVAKPHAIKTLVETLNTDKSFGWAFGDSEIIDTQSRRMYWDYSLNLVSPEMPRANYAFTTKIEWLRKVRPDVNFFSDALGSYPLLLHGNYIPGGFLARMDKVKECGGFNKNALLEDWYIALQLSKVAKVKYVDQILISYRWHDTNAMKNADRMMEITKQTFDYEIAQVCKNGNPRVQKMLRRFLKSLNHKPHKIFGKIDTSDALATLPPSIGNRIITALTSLHFKPKKKEQ